MKSPGKKAPAKKAPAKKEPAKKAPAGKAPAQKGSAQKASAQKAAAQKAAGKVAAKTALPPKKTLARKLTKLAPLFARLAPPESGAAVLDRLFTVITDRRTADPARSHSARLLSRGMAKVAQKFGEESVECLIEAVAGNQEALVAESADVLYHLLVMWVSAGVQPDQVWAELVRREGISGVAEKASRTGPGGTTKIP